MCCAQMWWLRKAKPSAATGHPSRNAWALAAQSLSRIKATTRRRQRAATGTTRSAAACGWARRTTPSARGASGRSPLSCAAGPTRCWPPAGGGGAGGGPAAASRAGLLAAGRARACTVPGLAGVGVSWQGGSTRPGNCVHPRIRIIHASPPHDRTPVFIPPGPRARASTEDVFDDAEGTADGGSRPERFDPCSSTRRRCRHHHRRHCHHCNHQGDGASEPDGSYCRTLGHGHHRCRRHGGEDAEQQQAAHLPEQHAGRPPGGSASGGVPGAQPHGRGPVRSAGAELRAAWRAGVEEEVQGRMKQVGCSHIGGVVMIKRCL